MDYGWSDKKFRAYCKWQKKLKRSKKNGRKPEQLRYNLYIKSAYWKARKKRYFKNHARVCAVCKTVERVDLHHIVYGNYSNERDEDLIALCHRHHFRFHEQHSVKRNMTDETAIFVQAAAFDDEAAAVMRNL